MNRFLSGTALAADPLPTPAASAVPLTTIIPNRSRNIIMPAWLQRDWCSPFVLSLGHFVWQGTLIAVLLAIALRATKSVAARYWLSLAALLLMAACPIVTLGWLMQPMSQGSGVQNSKLATSVSESPTILDPPILNFEHPTLPRDVGQVSNLPVIPSAPVVELNTDPSGRIPNLQPVTDDRSWWQKFAPQLTTMYLCGVGLMLLRLVFGLWGGRRLRRRVHLIDDPSLLGAMRRQAAALGLKLLPVLAYCERVTVPTVVGVLKPMILLPLTLTSGLSPEQIESVLAHELAHLRRYDHLVNLLQRVIESLLFFHPAMWWVSHRIREEREHCCDDLVVACGAMPLDYAKSLLVVAELSRVSQLDRSVAAVSLLATGPQKPSNLRQRIARLLGESATPSLRVSPRALLLTICIPLVALIVTIQSGAGRDRVARPESSKGVEVAEDSHALRKASERATQSRSPVSALAPTAGLPKSDNETNPPNNANGDLRSNPAAGSEDPRRAQVAPKRSPNRLVRVQEPDAKAHLDAADEVMPSGMVQRLGSNRFKVPGWWRRLAFAGNDEWVWLTANGRVSAIHRETGRVVKHHQLRLGEVSTPSLAASADGTRVAVGMVERPTDDNGQANFRVVVMSAVTTEHLHEWRWQAPLRNLSCLCFSGDGQTLLTGTDSGDVRLWNVQTGEQLRHQTFADSELIDAALSPDGRSALLIGWRESFLWNHADKAAPIKLAKPRRDSWNLSASFAPNGRMFASIWPDGPRLWDATTGELIAHLPTKEIAGGGEFAHAFTPNGRVLAVSVSTQDLVELWDIESRQRLATIPVRQPGRVAISRDGRWLAAAGDDLNFAATIVDLQTRKQVNQPGDGHRQEVRSVRFAGADSLVTMSLADAVVWDIKTGKPRQTVTQEIRNKSFLGLATSPDGTLIVTHGNDDSLGVWEKASGKRLFTLNGAGGTRGVRFHPNGSQFVSLGSDDVLRWWNAKDGKPLAAHKLDIPHYSIGYSIVPEPSFAFAPDAHSLFVTGDGLVEFDTRTGRRLRQIPTVGEVIALTLSPDGRWLATAEQNARDFDGPMRIVLRDRVTLTIVHQWPVRDPRPTAVNAASNREPADRLQESPFSRNGILGHGHGWERMRFSPDSKRLAWTCVGVRHGIDIAEVTSDRLVASIPVESQCWCLDFSPDGARIASGHKDSSVSVWDLENPAFAVARAGRGAPDPALDPTAGLPNSDKETNPPNNANGDRRSNPAAVSDDARGAQLKISYDMSGAETETRIFVQRLDPEFHAKHGRRDEYGQEEYGGVRFSRLKNGESLTIPDLRAGTYQVARYRLLDVVREGTGKAQKSVYLDRQWLELAERETKNVRVSRPAGRSISGRVVIPKDMQINTLVVHVCNEKARGCGTLNHRDVVQFDALNPNSDGTFKTEPLPPGRYKLVVEGYANHSLAVSGWIAPSWEGTAEVTLTESNAPSAIEVTLRKVDLDAWLKDEIAAEKSYADLGVAPDLPVGLEFLKPYPKLHSLSLDMTEPQFLEIVKQKELKTRRSVEGEKVTHHIDLEDGHTLIVMFGKEAKCSGIQRVRGEATAKGQSTEVNSDAVQQPDRTTEPLETELLRKLVRGGKIDSKTINAWITLVAARGAEDMEFARLVLAEFEKSCEGGDRTSQSRRYLLAVVTDIFEAWSSPRWRSQLARFKPDDLPQTIPPQVDAKLEREMLARVIQRGYETDRSGIANFSLAVRQLHHPAGREFLREVLRNPGAQSGPFEADNPPKTAPQLRPQTTPSPKGNSEVPPVSRWKDNIGGGWTDAKFVAAVGLAELGEAEGIDWLLARARPNDFGIDASLWSFPHFREASGSLRESSRLALADLFGHSVQVTVTELGDWWSNNRAKFTARPAMLKPILGREARALAPAAGLPNSGDDTKPTNNANGDLRSNPAAGSGDPRRAQATRDKRGDTLKPRLSRVEKSLDQLVSFEFDKRPFGKVLDAFRADPGIPIEVKAGAQAALDAPITLRSDSNEFAFVLAAVLDQVRLVAWIKSEWLMIGTREEAQKAGLKIVPEFEPVLKVLKQADGTMSWDALLKGRITSVERGQATRLIELSAHQEPVVRREALRAIVHLSDAAAFKGPEAALAQTKQADIQRVAWRAFAASGRDRPETLPTLVRAWGDGDLSVRQDYFDLQGLAKGTADRAYGHGSPEFRQFLMQHIGDPDDYQLSLVMLGLHDRDAETRLAAIQSGLARSRCPAPIVKELAVRLKDDDANCRVAAASLLLRIDREPDQFNEALAVLIQVANDGSLPMPKLVNAIQFLSIHRTMRLQEVLRSRESPQTSQREREFIRVALKQLEVELSERAAEVERAKKEKAATDSRDDAALRFAKSKAQVAKAEYEKMLDANRKVPGTIPQSMIIQFRCQSEIADLQVTREELRAAEKETGEVDVAIARKTVEPHKFQLDLMLEANRKVQGTVPQVQVVHARLNYELALLDVQKAERRAKGENTADLDVQSLRKQLDVAKAEYDQILDANRKVAGTVPQSQLDQSRLALERIVAELEVTETRAEQKPRRAQSPAIRGEIRWVAREHKTVWINLGVEDGIKKGMKFEVHEKETKDNRNQPPVVKGTIEVVRVIDRKTTEARIIEEQVKDTVAKGDPIVALNDADRQPNNAKGDLLSKPAAEPGDPSRVQKVFKPLECELVDAVTGQPIVENTRNVNVIGRKVSIDEKGKANVAETTNPQSHTLVVTGFFHFIKPKSGDVGEKQIAVRAYFSKSSNRITLLVPDEIMQRADRDELLLEWRLGKAPVYENYEPIERIPLKHLLSNDPKSGRDSFLTIKLTPKKLAE